MPNWKKIIVSGSDASLNSLVVSNGITGSLFGTASFAISSSRAVTASYVDQLRQTVTISGSIDLSPTIDPDPTGTILTDTFLFVSASNTTLGNDLYFRQDGNLVKWKWIEGQLYSGLLYGGIVTFSGSYVYVSSGSGIIVDYGANTGSEISPIVDYVKWNAITSSVVNITSSQVTYLSIDDTGALQQQSIPFTPQQYYASIPLGAIGHFNYSNISAFGGHVATAYGQADQTNTFIDAFGPLKVSGYDLMGQSGNLALSVGSGQTFQHGGFYAYSQEFPSVYNSTSAVTASIVRCYISSSNTVFDTNNGTLYTTINPGYYNNITTGVTSSVSNNNWTIQRVFSFAPTNTLYVYYGQSIYATLASALDGLAADPFVEGSTKDFTTFIGYLVAKTNATSMTNTDSKILEAGLFRGSGAGSGGGSISVATLEDLSDVSITSAVDGQALIYNSGLWINGNPTSASFAISSSRAVTSSFAITASYVTGSIYTSTNPALSASFATSALSASFATTSISSSFATSASFAVSSSRAVTSSFAITASFATSALSSSFATSALSSSFATTALSSSFASTASYVANSLITASVSSNIITFTKGNGTTFPITVATGSGTVSSISTSGNVNGITLTGGPITTTGTITLGGTLSNVQSNQLATSSLMIGSTNIALGATASSLTGLTAVTSTAFTGSLFGTSSWATNATTATTATNATNVAVTDTTTGTGPYYIAFTDGTTGNRAVRVDSTALTFNATTNTLTNATFSGSLIGTASFASSSISASFATSALSSSFATTSISASFASTASYVANSLITASVSSNTITFTKGNGTTFPITVATGSATSAFPFTGSATITGSLTVTGSVNSTGGYTGSLLGTASWATNVVNNGVTSVATAGTVSGITLTGGTITSTGTITLGGSISGLTNANLSGTAGITNANLANSSITVGSTGISLGGTATTLAGLTSVTSTSFTGSLLGTASFATSALSSSFASTASFVNTLNQSVIVTGSMAIGTSSLGPSENSITLGARDSANEGGQIGFNAPGGTYTSASFIDNWQNKVRILKGNNTTSTGLVAQWDLHTTQLNLPAYTAASSFVGTATANLAVDSGGNVITVSTSGGSVFPYTGNAVITGSLTTTGIIYAQPNGGMYFQGGDDAALYDINISNHMGIYGVQDSTVGSIKLGSGGGIISGRSGNIGIGTITPTSASLTVNGNVWANSFTGSLLGTSSWATNVVNNGVTSVATAGSVSGITLTGGTITSTGTITLGGSISGLTNANLSGTAGITNANLANSSITVGSTAISLGGTATTIAGLTSVTSTAFTGSLLGTASFATSALSSSFATTSISSSFATSALSASFATTASFASNGISGLTSNFIPKATSATSLADSGMQDDSTNIIIDRTTIWQGKAAMGSLTTPVGGMVSYVTDADLLAYTGNQWTGEAIRGTAGANITVGQLCYMNTAGRWRPADADANPASTTLLGICLLSASGLGTTFILLKGFVETSYSLGSTPGEPLYIEPASGAGAGYVTPIVPTTAGQFVRLIGHTHNGTTIRFNPDNIWIEL
jgi:hypothetical protein